MCHSSNISAAVPPQGVELKEGMIAEISVNYRKTNFIHGEVIKILNYDSHRDIWAVVSAQDETFGYIDERYIVNPRMPETEKVKDVEVLADNYITAIVNPELDPYLPLIRFAFINGFKAANPTA